MATSPGRSAIQPKPKAMPATATRKRMTRIIPTSLPAKCVRSVARKLTRRREGRLPRLSFSDPTLGWRPCCRIKLAEIDECFIDSRVCGFLLDTRQYGGSIVTCWRVDGTNPDELGGTCLKTFQVPAG